MRWGGELEVGRGASKKGGEKEGRRTKRTLGVGDIFVSRWDGHDRATARAAEILLAKINGFTKAEQHVGSVIAAKAKAKAKARGLTESKEKIRDPPYE